MSSESEKSAQVQAQPEPAKPAAFVPPDGGTKAWLTVAGGWLCQFCSFGFINALGTFQDEYQEEILPDKSSSSISWILTVQLFLMFFLSQPVGLGVDMFGVRPILITALFFTVGGLVALSFATEYWQIFLAQSLCFGLGVSGTFISGLVVPGQYFKQKRALALGIVASGSSCGGVVFPIMLAQLFGKIGFRSTLRWVALMIGVMLIIANVLITPALPPKGLAGRRSLISLSTFKKPTYLLYASGSFFFFWGLFGPFDYLPTFAMADASTSSIALYTVAIVNAASLPGRILPNMYANRFGCLRSMTVAAFFSAVVTLVIWLPIRTHHSLGGLIVFAILFGFSSGAFVSLMTPALIEVAGGHVSDLGVMIGTFFAIVAIASLTGLPIQSATITVGADGSYEMLGLILFCGVSMILGVALLTWANVLRERGKREEALSEGN